MNNPRFLETYEARLDELLDKRSRSAVLMQAIPIYMGFVQERLKVAPGLALADFPEVSKYPSTQRSKEVGASICASINMLIGQQVTDRGLGAWSIEFWNRGMHFKPIDFSFLEHNDAST